jgi:hypothetical protein
VNRPGSPEFTFPRLRVDLNGDWYDGEEQVTHPGILANLRANLRHDQHGYFLQTRVRVPVEVADTPFVVDRLELEGEALRAILNDGTVTAVDPDSLWLGPGDVPYCRIPGRFAARLSRPAAFQLLRLVEYDEIDGRAILRLGDREHRLERRLT